jgi:hypothetical protein
MPRWCGPARRVRGRAPVNLDRNAQTWSGVSAWLTKMGVRRWQDELFVGLICDEATLLERLFLEGIWVTMRLVTAMLAFGALLMRRMASFYNPRWSPEIYSLSKYVNERGFQAQRIISVDWGIHDQHALAPKKLRVRMRDLWTTFKRWARRLNSSRRQRCEIFSRGGQALRLRLQPPRKHSRKRDRRFSPQYPATPG